MADVYAKPDRIKASTKYVVVYIGKILA